MSLLIGIDVGGTFTDVVAWDRSASRLYSTKVPSTPPELESGVVRGVEKILEIAGRGPADVERIIHGTTISLNAILERKGACLGLLTTAGFEGTLEIGRQKRSILYDYFIDAETPIFLCPRRRIYGVPQRTGPEGEEIEPLDEGAVARAVDELRDIHRVQAIAVCYLNAYASPRHEQRTLQIIQERFPDARVSLSSVVDPRFREYERLVLTAFDAYIKPVTENYVRRLEERLAGMGVETRLQIMQCRGGITDAASVRERPVVTVKSGVAAGVIGGNFAGALAGMGNLITLDIGGTSCDIALVRDNQPLIALEGKTGKYPLRQPMVDVTSIGAGGGSIAWLDAAGGLLVGPQSAGANPGPACYGNGGIDATVTDASVALGYLNPTNFAYGEISLRPDLARQAVAGIAEKLGLDVEEAALGIHRILNSRMADEMRLISIGRGYDPRQFALVALGGGGAVHAGRLAELLSIPTVLVPPVPGVLSALGLLVADIEHDQAVTWKIRLDEIDPPALEKAYLHLEESVGKMMAADGVKGEEIRTIRSAEMRYSGQSYEIEIPLLPGAVDGAGLAALAGAFHRRHEEIYGHSMPGDPVEIVNLRVVQKCPLQRPVFEPQVPTDGSGENAITGHRPALFDIAEGYVDVPVYDRNRLRVGVKIAGPAVVEQSDTTTILYPRHTARVDAYRNLVIHVPAVAGEVQP